MSKVTLALGTIGSLNEKTLIPYWFTTDGTIHLASNTNPKEIIDLKTVDVDNLYQIKASINSGLITIDKPELLDEIYVEKYNELAGQITPVIPEIKTPVDSRKQDAVKLQQIVQEAKKLLSLAANKILTEVGTNKVDDGILSVGITDNLILETALDLELNGKKRTTVIAALQKRISAIKSVAIDIENDKDFEINEEDVADIIIDGEEGTIKTLENEDSINNS